MAYIKYLIAAINVSIVIYIIAQFIALMATGSVALGLFGCGATLSVIAYGCYTLLRDTYRQLIA